MKAERRSRSGGLLAAAGLCLSLGLSACGSTEGNIALGVLGAIVGGFVLRALIAAGSLIFGLVGAVVGACILIWLYQRYFKGRF